MILVSACLVGKNCKYNGKNNKCDNIVEFLKDKEYIEICPECMGGLLVPRNASEICGDKVISKTGEDVTRYFLKGAKETLKIAKKHKNVTAILKQGSPSCGFGRIYDGTFTGTKISGMGITAKVLDEQGINILTEEDFM